MSRTGILQARETQLDVARIRADFPALQQQVHGHPLVFLDSAASAQKPQAVLDAMHQIYTTSYANVHRGAYSFSRQTTDRYEAARATIAGFLGAASPNEIVFTRNATEGVNLIAYSYARTVLQPGDEILITDFEHHANDLPWRAVAQERGLQVKRIPLRPDGTLDLAVFEQLLTPRVRLLSFAHVSNVLGTITDPAPLIARAHANGTVVVLDACQSAPHMPLHVQALGCDFLVCSGHKLFGPTGVGVLYGRAELLADMPPFLTGGDVARDVGFDAIVWEDAPLKFEAGTPMFVEAVGLSAAVDYVQSIGMAAVRAHEQELTAYALERFEELHGVQVFGPRDPAIRGGVVTFTVEGWTAHQVASALDRVGIAVRSGRHCAHPLHKRLGLEATVRASFTVYNDHADVDALVDALHALQHTPPEAEAEAEQGFRQAV